MTRKRTEEKNDQLLVSLVVALVQERAAHLHLIWLQEAQKKDADDDCRWGWEIEKEWTAQALRDFNLTIEDFNFLKKKIDVVVGPFLLNLSFNPLCPPLSKKDKEKIPAIPPIEAIEMAQLLSDSIAKNVPNRTPPTKAELMKWAWEAERINRIDGHDWIDIRHLIEWSQSDDFWKQNILSMGKLRKQWNQLSVKMNGKSSLNDRMIKRTEDILKRGL